MSGPTPSGCHVPFVPATVGPAARAAFALMPARSPAAESAPIRVACTPANCASRACSVIGFRHDKSLQAGAEPLAGAAATVDPVPGPPSRASAMPAAAKAARVVVRRRDVETMASSLVATDLLRGLPTGYVDATWD